MSERITKKQKKLLNIIYKYIEGTGYSPNFIEMRDALGVCSNQSILDYLNKLEEKKFIKRDKGIARSLKILPLGYKVLDKSAATPALGTASTGAPMEKIEITGEWQSLAKDVAKLNANVFLLKISGDSMINAGIDNGDIILVKEDKEFISGDIVLANIDGEATVKRFISDDEPPYVYLKPENPNYENILFDERNTRMTGKVLFVLRNRQLIAVK